MYQICIAGSASGETVENGRVLALAAGEAVANLGHSLLTGATTGLPHFAVKGYARAGGKMSIGLSPASTKVEHVLKYRLPTKPFDAIIYTGLHYSMRDVFLINSCDAVIYIGGRLGTFHELAVGLELDKPMGILQGAGGISSEVMDVLHAAGKKQSNKMVFSDDAQELVSSLDEILDRELKKYKDIYEP